jgi:hypothetical protein
MKSFRNSAKKMMLSFQKELKDLFLKKWRKKRMIKSNLIKSKNSQITIMVILALIIVISIALVVVLVRKPSGGVTAFENPSAYIEECAKQSLTKNVNLLLESNGYFNKTDNSVFYLGKNVPYACKSDRFYYPCINQEPLFIEHFRIELQNLTKKEIEACFGNLTKAFEQKGYDVTSSKNSSYTVRFQDDAVAIDIEKSITLKKLEESKVYNKFFAQITSPLYRLVDTERHIVNFESTVCNFDYLTWENYYRDIIITKFMTGAGDKVYTLTHADSGKTLSFAVRSCALPAGI